MAANYRLIAIQALEKSKKFIAKPIGIIVLFALGLAMVAFVEALLYSPNLITLGKLVGIFALLGAFLGVIYGTDPREQFKVRARPLLRTLVSGAIGTTYAVLLHLSPLASVICVGIFAILGWLGMKWARYVDF